MAHRHPAVQLAVAACMALGGAALAATPPGTAPQPPAARPQPPALAPTSDGQAVHDPAARTLWARCVEGMVWNGATCTGRALLLTRSEATARAKARNTAEGTAWRLPRTQELKRLVDKRAHPPGVDPVLFPAAPLGLHWSGTASLRRTAINPYNYDNVTSGRTSGNRLAALEGWAVDMESGQAYGDVARTSRLPVRLVRGAD